MNRAAQLKLKELVQSEVWAEINYAISKASPYPSPSFEQNDGLRNHGQAFNAGIEFALHQMLTQALGEPEAPIDDMDGDDSIHDLSDALMKSRGINHE